MRECGETLRDGLFDFSMFENKNYWLSCNKFTILVVVNIFGDIMDTAPITRKFVGQPFENLKKWAGKFGNLKIEEILK